MPAPAGYYRYLPMSDEELQRVDPVEMNLVVAKSIPELADLDIPRYQGIADEWAEGVRRRLPHAERVFRSAPHEWEDDINFIRLSVLCEHLDCEVGISYNEDQRDVKKIKYTNPSDLFLNGLMDTNQGTCGNMSMAHVAVAWRLGWPVSLACVASHFISRYDDGERRYNFKTTKTGKGGFCSSPDSYFIKEFKLPPQAIECGSELRALTARERLAMFLALRGRHMKDIGEDDEAERDQLLARHLFPSHRYTYQGLTWISIRQSLKRFAWEESGSPLDLANAINAFYAPLGSLSDQVLVESAVDENLSDALFESFALPSGSIR